MKPSAEPEREPESTNISLIHAPVQRSSPAAPKSAVVPTARPSSTLSCESPAVDKIPSGSTFTQRTQIAPKVTRRSYGGVATTSSLGTGGQELGPRDLSESGSEDSDDSDIPSEVPWCRRNSDNMRVSRLSGPRRLPRILPQIQRGGPISKYPHNNHIR